MPQPLSYRPASRAQRYTQQAFSALERFIHIEAVSGAALLVATLIALIWANSAQAQSYEALWHLPITLGLGDWQFTRSLHFYVNDALMTVFFLVVGMEIRREIHDGALANLRQAALPVIAAFGGVLVPALLYLAFNRQAPLSHGWAIPTATDIAFAIGVLALLGRGIPSSLRIFLLTLAIIDDVIAVLIIAVVYSGGLDYSGLLVAGLGMLMVLALQWIGIGTAYAYVIPGAVIWFGLLKTGAHPSLAGVVLGLMTPVVRLYRHAHPLEALASSLDEVRRLAGQGQADELAQPLSELRKTQRELLPPVIRVQKALHPWVAFGIMPLFALANAGVALGTVDLGLADSQKVMFGVFCALVLGKPLGIFLATWITVRLGLCRLAPDMNWNGVLLIGLLGGIGFTMSIFVANLAFTSENLLSAAKLGILLGSATAACVGFLWGVLLFKRARSRA
ncbi:Na+/H+ antiporter NhaA [Pseudomonas sp. B392_1p]|uniref:Na+/H+ antiporter NhaA n=1 Tax=Pseudomonas sp. B392_1p TaxID=3457507 RepID=UPI003FD3476B